MRTLPLGLFIVSVAGYWAWTSSTSSSHSSTIELVEIKLIDRETTRPLSDAIAVAWSVFLSEEEILSGGRASNGKLLIQDVPNGSLLALDIDGYNSVKQTLTCSQRVIAIEVTRSARGGTAVRLRVRHRNGKPVRQIIVDGRGGAHSLESANGVFSFTRPDFERSVMIEGPYDYVECTPCWLPVELALDAPTTQRDIVVQEGGWIQFEGRRPETRVRITRGGIDVAAIILDESALLPIGDYVVTLWANHKPPHNVAVQVRANEVRAVSAR